MVGPWRLAVFNQNDATDQLVGLVAEKFQVPPRFVISTGLSNKRPSQCNNWSAPITKPSALTLALASKWTIAKAGGLP